MTATASFPEPDPDHRQDPQDAGRAEPLADGGGPVTIERIRPYLLRGWSLLPIAPLSKDPPAGYRWKKHCRQRANESQVRAWLKRWPDMNVGVVLGQVSGIVVLERDGGESSQAAALMKHLNLPPTLTALAVRGPHLYFRSEDRLASRTRVFSDGSRIELRAEGEYAVLPPSTHPLGRRYEWATGPADPAPLPTSVYNLFPVPRASKVVVADLPDHLRELLERDTRLRDAWEGRLKTKDPTGSGRDMVLAHVAVKAGLDFPTFSSLARTARYEKRTPRTVPYLEVTFARAASRRGGRTYKPPPAAAFIEAGLWAPLSPPEKALLPVLKACAEPPAGLVRKKHKGLAALSGLSVRVITPILKRLQDRGHVHMEPVGTGWNVWVVPMLRSGIPFPSCQQDGETSPKLRRAHLEAHRTGKANRMRLDMRGTAFASCPQFTVKEGKPPAPLPGVAPVGAPSKGEACDATEPSMRLVSETLPAGRKRVSQVQADGRRIRVWEGSLDEWVRWTPPKDLRGDPLRRARGAPSLTG